jgi:hypothetical protein
MTRASPPLVDVDRSRASHAARGGRRRLHARVAAFAGAAALAAALAACKDDDAQASALPPPDAAASHVGAPVPPPPTLASLPATTTVAAADAAAPAPAPSEAAPAEARPSTFDPRRLDSVRAHLDAELAKGASCSADAQCRSVAVGGKACGGPTGYRAYSVDGADPKTIESLAADERQLSQQEARASGRVSPCFMLADPGAHCEAHRCVTGPAGGLLGNGRRVPPPPAANASAVR